MNARFMTRDSRALLIGGAVLALALIGRLLPAWYSWVREHRTSAARALDDLALAQSAVSDAPATRASLSRARAQLAALAPALMRSPNAGLAAANAASTISDAATVAGLALGSVSVKSDTAPAGPFSRPRVSGSARGDISGLTQFLLLLETGPLHLSLRELVVTQGEPGATNDRPEDLRIEFVVEALAIPGDGSRTVEHQKPSAAGRPGT